MNLNLWVAWIWLLLGAGATFKRHPRKVVAAIGILNRRVVQKDRLQALDQAFDFSFAHQIDHTGVGFGAQAVSGFLGHTGATAT